MAPKAKTNAATQSTKTATAAATTEAAAHIIVTGPRKGRWRAGRHFTPEPVQIFLSDLSEAESEALVADPLLSVSFVGVEPPTNERDGQ